VAVKVKSYQLSSFVQSSNGQKYTSKDTLWLKHSGDFVTLGVHADQTPDVASVTIQSRIHLNYHHEGIAGGAGQTSVKVLTSKLSSSDQDYKFVCKEQYKEPNSHILFGLLKGDIYVDNMDIEITLLHVGLTDGSEGKVGQDDIVAGLLPWSDIVTAATWIVGIIGLCVAGYMVYRIYRWKKHGDKLFPHLGGGQ